MVVITRYIPSEMLLDGPCSHEMHGFARMIRFTSFIYLISLECLCSSLKVGFSRM